MFLISKCLHFMSLIGAFFVEPFFIRKYFTTSLFCGFNFRTNVLRLKKNITYYIKVPVLSLPLRVPYLENTYPRDMYSPKRETQ